MSSLDSRQVTVFPTERTVESLHAVRFLVDGADILVMVELHPLQPFPDVRQLLLALRVRLDPEEIPQEIVVDSQF